MNHRDLSYKPDRVTTQQNTFPVSWAKIRLGQDLTSNVGLLMCAVKR